MSPNECESDINRELARQGKLEFAIEPHTSSLKRLEVVDWLTSEQHAS